MRLTNERPGTPQQPAPPICLKVANRCLPRFRQDCASWSEVREVCRLSPITVLIDGLDGRKEEHSGIQNRRRDAPVHELVSVVAILLQGVAIGFSPRFTGILSGE